MLINKAVSSKKWIEGWYIGRTSGIRSFALIAVNGCPMGQRRMQTPPVELFEAYLPDLLNIRQSQEYLSDSVLHEGGHSVSDTLVFQCLHWRLALNE